MLENESELLELQELLRKKFSQLNNEDVEKVSNQLTGLAFFLVRLQIKRHSQPSQLNNAEGFDGQSKNNSP